MLKKVDKVTVKGRGGHAIVLERTAYPGVACKGCGAANHCILKEIASYGNNRNLLPLELRSHLTVKGC